MYRAGFLVFDYLSKFVSISLFSYVFMSLFFSYVLCLSSFLCIYLFFIYNVFLLDKNWTQCHSFQTALINHRSTGWLGLEGTSSSDAPAKQIPLEQATQDHVQDDFEYLQGRKLHIFSGSLFQCFVTIKVNKFLFVFRWNFLHVAGHH